MYEVIFSLRVLYGAVVPGRSVEHEVRVFFSYGVLSMKLSLLQWHRLAVFVRVLCYDMA